VLVSILPKLDTAEIEASLERITASKRERIRFHRVYIMRITRRFELDVASHGRQWFAADVRENYYKIAFLIKLLSSPEL
jgi:hypothetical protein